jgi:UDP-glucose 4-epimerase
MKYYDNNVYGSIVLVEAMQAAQIYKLIFSSSATVYGVPQYLPYDELHPTAPINTYGNTKLHVEHILQDLAESDSGWAVASLRYFNPVGAHESGLIGESPKGIPNNLMPYICQVAIGKQSHLSIFGDDYETKDGTGERDYIHVMDLAEGHAAALDLISKVSGFETINLGTGSSYSVLELIDTFENANKLKIPKLIKARRSGDLPIYYAKADKARKLLNWKAKRDLKRMCESSWNFQKNSQDL